MESKAISILEHQHVAEMQEDLSRKLLESQQQESGGRVESLRTTVLAQVVGENYDRARQTMRDYLTQKSSYPDFQWRASRYIQHCTELIQAIQTKRNFPGIASLSMAKQQEIHEKVLVHFEELKRNLKHVEKAEREQRLADMRSTVWVVRVSAYVAGGFLLTAFLLDLRAGMFSSFFTVTEVMLGEASTWLIKLVGL